MSLTAEEQGYVTRLERRLQALEERVGPYVTQVDVWRANGADNLFTGHGNQLYGGGGMKIGPRGIVIDGATVATNTIYWVPDRAAMASDANPTTQSNLTYLAGSAGLVAGDTEPRMLLQSYTDDGSHWAYVEMRANKTDDVYRVVLSAASAAFPGEINAVLIASVTAGAIFSLYGCRLQLASFTSDPAILADGDEWYRSDTDKFRGRANGATDSFAMEAWVTTGFLAAARGNWKVFYSNGTGVFTELALGAANTVLTSNGASSAPTFSVNLTGWTVTAQATTYSAVANDVVLCTGTFTVTLPDAAANTMVIIKNVSTGLITVDGLAADTIDGEATITLAQWDSATLIGIDTASWAII